MKFGAIVAFCITICTFLSAANASTVTIDFDSADRFVDLRRETYTEDSFVLTRTAGFPGGFITGKSLNLIALSTNGAFSFARTDGGAFQFLSFRHGSVLGGLKDSFEIIGFSNGVQVADFGEFTEPGFVTENIDLALATILLDELRIIGTGFGGGPSIILDNLVFNTVDAPAVPLPAASVVFLTGIGGACVLKRKLKARDA